MIWLIGCKGMLGSEVAKQLDIIDKDKFNFLWVTEFPLLEWSEEENRYKAMHHPFTMPMDEDIQKAVERYERTHK